MAKFQNLKTYYRRERKKYFQYKSGSGADNCYFPKWEHFERLQYLDNIILPTKSTSNLDDIEITVNVLPSDPSTSQLNVSENSFSEDEPDSLPPISQSQNKEKETLPELKDNQSSSVTPKIQRPYSEYQSSASFARKKRKTEEEFFENVNKCLNSVSQKKKPTVNEAFGNFIVAKLESIDCPKRQADLRNKLYSLLDDIDEF